MNKLYIFTFKKQDMLSVVENVRIKHHLGEVLSFYFTRKVQPKHIEWEHPGQHQQFWGWGVVALLNQSAPNA